MSNGDGGGVGVGWGGVGWGGTCAWGSPCDKLVADREDFDHCEFESLAINQVVSWSSGACCFSLISDRFPGIIGKFNLILRPVVRTFKAARSVGRELGNSSVQ